MADKIKAPSIVYIKGKEMTRYTMNLILEQWIKPFIDISAWKFFDLSAKNRDNTNDQVLQDVINAEKRIRSIFKEPTITPTKDQLESLGISKAWDSPIDILLKPLMNYYGTGLFNSIYIIFFV